MTQAFYILISTLVYIVYWIFNKKPSTFEGFLVNFMSLGIGLAIAVLILMPFGLVQLNEIGWRVASALTGSTIAYIIVKILVPAILPKRKHFA